MARIPVICLVAVLGLLGGLVPPVQAGIDSPEYQAALAEYNAATAEVNKAEAGLAAAKAEHERFKKDFDQAAAALDALDKKHLALRAKFISLRNKNYNLINRLLEVYDKIKKQGDSPDQRLLDEKARLTAQQKNVEREYKKVEKEKKEAYRRWRLADQALQKMGRGSGQAGENWRRWRKALSEAKLRQWEALQALNRIMNKGRRRVAYDSSVVFGPNDPNTVMLYQIFQRWGQVRLPGSRLRCPD